MLIILNFSIFFLFNSSLEISIFSFFFLVLSNFGVGVWKFQSHRLLLRFAYFHSSHLLSLSLALALFLIRLQIIVAFFVSENISQHHHHHNHRHNNFVEAIPKGNLFRLVDDGNEEIFASNPYIPLTSVSVQCLCRFACSIIDASRRSIWSTN